MNGFKSILAAISALLLMSGCSSAFYASVNAADGMYGEHDTKAIAEQQRKKAELQREAAEARRTDWERRLAAAQNQITTEQQFGSSYSSVLADSYESAYARRLRGFTSPTYSLPSSYYELRYGDAYNYVTAYDPAFYNVMVSGDQVWVEPKYISSMFGTWGARNVTMATASWYYGWDMPYYGYGAWWGFPHYSWWDWNWNVCYNPYYSWWGYGWGSPWYYHHYYPHVIHGPAYYPPHHGGGHRPSGGGPGVGREQVVSRPAYTSPSSGKDYGNRQPARGTVNGTGVFGRQSTQSGASTGRGSMSGSGTSTISRGTSSTPTRTVRSSGSSSSWSNSRRGSSSYFNQSSNENTGQSIRSNTDPWGGASRSSSSSSFGGGYPGGSSSSGHRGGNSLGR